MQLSMDAYVNTSLPLLLRDGGLNALGQCCQLLNGQYCLPALTSSAWEGVPPTALQHTRFSADYYQKLYTDLRSNIGGTIQYCSSLRLNNNAVNLSFMIVIMLFFQIVSVVWLLLFQDLVFQSEQMQYIFLKLMRCKSSLVKVSHTIKNRTALGSVMGYRWPHLHFYYIHYITCNYFLSSLEKIFGINYLRYVSFPFQGTFPCVCS